MPDSLPVATSRTIQTPHGPAVGTSHRWGNGQYCVILTEKGIVGCGIFDIPVCDHFGMAVAIARGTPENPLVEPEDLYEAKIAAVSKLAAEFGVKEGMTGLEALGVLMAK